MPCVWGLTSRLLAVVEIFSLHGTVSFVATRLCDDRIFSPVTPGTSNL